MDVSIKINKLSGEIRPISSKSTCHRAIFCVLLSRDITTIYNFDLSNDIKSSISALISLNCDVQIFEDSIVIDSRNIKITEKSINCMESGTTLRFIIPILIFLNNKANVDGIKHLKKRPLDVFKKLFKYDSEELPIIFEGELKPGEYKLDGSISSQFISGLLFVLPLLNGDSKISFDKELESRSYVDLTIDILLNFGIKIKKKNNEFYIKGNQEYLKGIKYYNEVDESNLAFFKVANDLGANIKFTTYNKVTSQPDHVIDQIIENKTEVINVSNCPDLLPILALWGCFQTNPVKLINAKRTRLKESDRMSCTMTELNKLGAEIRITEDTMFITPVNKFKYCATTSHGDHRVAMTLAIAALKMDKIKIHGVEDVDKSYPNFLSELKNLGAIIK